MHDTTHKKLWQPACDDPGPSDRRTHILHHDVPKHINTPKTNLADPVTPVDPDHYNRSEQALSVPPNHPRFDIRALNNSIGWEGEIQRIVAEEQAITGRQRIIEALQDMPPLGSPTDISSNDNDEP